MSNDHLYLDQIKENFKALVVTLGKSRVKALVNAAIYEVNKDRYTHEQDPASNNTGSKERVLLRSVYAVYGAKTFLPEHLISQSTSGKRKTLHLAMAMHDLFDGKEVSANELDQVFMALNGQAQGEYIVCRKLAKSGRSFWHVSMVQ